LRADFAIHAADLRDLCSFVVPVLHRYGSISRISVNPKVILTTCAVALLLGVTCLLGLHRAGSLPRIRLSNGGEFRVLKVCYGRENDHHLGGAPKSFFWAWNHLPKHLQRVIPYPDAGVSGLSPVAGKAAVSIWYADIDPGTGKPLLGPADYALITLDSGERLGRVWPEPADDYRQIFLHDPPRHSKYLHVELGAEYDPVAFSVVNPAFSGAHAEKTNQRGNVAELSVCGACGEWL
jgi:hypothetical protein